VLTSRKLTVGLATVITVLAVQAIAMIPVALADCVATVHLLTGEDITVTIPTATSPVPMPSPGNVTKIACPSDTTSTTTTDPTATTSTTSSSTSSTSNTSTSMSIPTISSSSSISTSPSSSTSTTTSRSTSTSTTPLHSAPHPTQPGKKQTTSAHSRPGTTTLAHAKKPSSHKHKGKAKNHGKNNGKKKGRTTGSTESKKSSANKRSVPSANGVPTPANPTFSFAQPGAAPLGVPNFFIDSFRIPPFLLPIYQAAGIQYDVPWQVLAAINEIETDYGRNLSVSSAGAVGWMQFLPSTWKQWGIDANGDNIADPYNPVDAIFSAARYLRAAGANTNVSQAIFAYNHASWYVQSVLLRAKLIGGMPDQLIGALTGLVQGHFPVAAPSKYADNAVEALARHRVNSANAAIPIGTDPNSKAVSIFAKQNSPVIAVNDGKIVTVGENAQWGKYVQLQDQTGNIYTYAHLGSIPSEYPVPRPVKISASQLAKELSAPALPAPKAPASAGAQQSAPTPSTATATKVARNQPITLPITPKPTADKPTADTSKPTADSSTTIATPMVKERLFADPSRPRSYAAGGAVQLRNNPGSQISSFHNYFSDVLHLGKNQYTLEPLKAGAVVVAGTILGRLAPGASNLAPHVQFMVQPAGKNAPYIDPKPILDGWKLLEATAVYRAAGVDPFFGPGAKNPSIGQILLMSKEQLQNRILQDPHVQIYACGRRDIQAGLVDRRVLATLEFLSASGLDPSVSGLICGHGLPVSTSSTDAAAASGSSVDIDKINNVPILGHTGPGSVADIAIRRLLTLQGAMKPDQIISTMSYKGQSNTLALPDHANRIQVEFTPLFGKNKKLSNEIKSILQPGQWVQLINRISQIPEPVVPIAPSRYAIRTAGAN